MKPTHYLRAGALTGLLALAACADKDPTADETAADESPTFSQLQQEVLIPSCGGAGCHGASDPGGALDLESDGAYDALLFDPCDNEVAVAEGLVRVAPGDLEQSFFYAKITDPMGMGDLMPPWGMSDEQITLIEAWILAGAER